MRRLLFIFSFILAAPIFSAEELDENSLTHKKQENPERIVIQPGDRSKDLKEAFELLSKAKATSEVVYILRNGTKLSGITDVSVLPGGTMLLFKMNTTTGTHYQVVPVENIVSVNPE